MVRASKKIQEALPVDPAGDGELLSEGLYFIDRVPLRGFYTIDAEKMLVEIVNVKPV